MAEVRTGEFVKYSNPMIDDLRAMHAWLWDCGPEEPDLPEPPKMPQGKEGDPAYDLAKLQYRRALKAYEDGLLRYEKLVVEWMEFQKRMGGPVEVKFWSVDAFDAILHDLRAVFDGRQSKPRYYVSARTSPVQRNRLVSRMKEILTREDVKLDVAIGLPKGVKPGHGHQANLERQIAGEKEFVDVMRSDPHFGQEMHV